MTINEAVRIVESEVIGEGIVGIEETEALEVLVTLAKNLIRQWHRIAQQPPGL